MRMKLSKRTKFLVLLDLAMTSLVFFIFFCFSLPLPPHGNLSRCVYTCLTSAIFINALYITPAAFFIHYLFKTIDLEKPVGTLFKAVIPASISSLAGIAVILPFAWLGGTDARALASYFFTPILGTLFAASVAGLAIRAMRSNRKNGESNKNEEQKANTKPLRSPRKELLLERLSLLLIVLTLLFPSLVLVYGLFPRNGKNVSSVLDPTLKKAQTPGERLEALSAALSDPDRTMRFNAVQEMESYGAPAMPFLVRALREDGEEGSLERVIKALENVSRKAQTGEAVPALEKVLYWKMEKPGNTVRDVRVAALCALMGLETDKAYEAIAKFQQDLEEKALHDKDESVRVQSIAWLGYFGPSVVPFIVGAVREEDMACAAAAVRTLGEMGYYADQAVPGLKKTLRWHNQYFPYETFCALKKIGTTAAMDAFKQWKREVPVPALRDDCSALSVYDGGPPRALGCLTGKWQDIWMEEEWRRGQESEGEEK
jgi:hypothetical protein